MFVDQLIVDIDKVHQNHDLLLVTSKTESGRLEELSEIIHNISQSQICKSCGFVAIIRNLEY